MVYSKLVQMLQQMSKLDQLFQQQCTHEPYQCRNPRHLLWQ